MALRGRPFLMPVLAFALSGLLLSLLSQWLPGFAFRITVAGALAAIALAIVHTVVSLVIAVTDDTAFERFAIRSLAERDRRVASSLPAPATPGILFLEINGLAEPIAREAIAGGHAPTMARWQRSGTHRLVAWECDLSSQTGASQAGILHGDNFNIPAFRWYDKASRTILVSNHVRDGAAAIERQVSNGRGLLAGDGASRGTLLSGDAVDSVLTCSTVGRWRWGKRERAFGDITLYGWARLATLFAWDLVGELAHAVKHELRGAQPPFRPIGAWTLAQAFTKVTIRELGVQTVVGDMIRGVPTVYLSFAGYDAVAHRSGIRGKHAFRALRGIDRQLALLERANRYAARHYEIAVLSGHGQSEGPTFRQRYGQTLGQIVGELLPRTAIVVEPKDADETMGTAATLLSDCPANDRWYGRWIARVAGQSTGDRGAIEPGPDLTRPHSAGIQSGGAHEALVLASGNIGLLSFPAWPHRLTQEELSIHFPRLIPGLVGHDGIAFVLVNSAQHGAIVIGAAGRVYLDHDGIEGDDPLAGFEPRAARHLRRYSLFANCPDVLIHGRYDRESGKVVTFEETVGSHGGLGGPQTQPFLLYPKSLKVDSPLIGARALHEVFTRWRRELAATEAPAAPARERV
jgi:hypothetical protein